MSPLSQRLLEATAEETRALRSTPLFQRLAWGELERPRYVRLLGCLQALYAELEWGLLWHRRHPALGPLCLPELWRNELLQDDLRALLGPGWYACASRQEAAAHVERMSALCDEASGLLAAHAWLLHATELPSAGQRGPGLARAFRLRGDGGTRFLHHATHLDGAAYRAHLLDTLDQRPLTSPAREALVEEARRAVRSLTGLFERLGREPAARSVYPLTPHEAA